MQYVASEITCKPGVTSTNLSLFSQSLNAIFPATVTSTVIELKQRHSTLADGVLVCVIDGVLVCVVVLLGVIVGVSEGVMVGVMVGVGVIFGT